LVTGLGQTPLENSLSASPRDKLVYLVLAAAVAVVFTTPRGAYQQQHLLALDPLTFMSAFQAL